MKIFPYSTLFCLAALLVLTSCRQPEEYKAEADETVYQIIDQKWQDELPAQANYKISDVPGEPNDLRPEFITPPSGTVSLVHAVALATANNRDYQLEKELLYVSALDLRLIRHAYESQFFGGASGDYVKQGDNESVGVLGNVGLNRLFASGAVLTTNVTTAWVDILTGNGSRGLTTIWDTAVTQPLLRGSGSRIALETLTQAERDTIYQIRSFNQFRRNFVVSVITRYYLVLQQHDLLENAEWNQRVLNDVLAKTETLTRAGRLPGYELDRVQQDAITAHDTMLGAQKDYRQALDDFKLFLNVPITAEFRLDDKELAQLRIAQPILSALEVAAGGNSQTLTDQAVAMLEEELDELPAYKGAQMQSSEPASAEVWDTDFSETDAIETALLLRPDVANAEDAVADAQRKVEVAADSLGAELNLNVQTSASTQGSSDSAARVGLDLDLPLDRMAEANDYRKALIALTQSERAFELAKDTAALEVRRAYRELNNSAKEYAVQKQALELAQKRYQNTLSLMSYGRASSRRVLDAQEDLFNARLEAMDALIDHTIATLEFYRDTAVLQIRQDGMWKLNALDE